MRGNSALLEFIYGLTTKDPKMESKSCTQETAVGKKAIDCEADVSKKKLHAKYKRELRQRSDSYRKYLTRRKNDPRHRWQTLLSRVKRHRFDIDITFAEFCRVTQQVCEYCGELGEHDLRGLDRVNSARGYLSDNIVPCCKECNFMKGSMTKSDFLRKVAAISNVQHVQSKNRTS